MVIIPRPDEIEDHQGSDGRHRLRKHNFIHDFKVACAVNHGSFGIAPAYAFKITVQNYKSKIESTRPREPDQERIIGNTTVYKNEIPSVKSYMSSLENEAKSLGVIDATITGASTAVTSWLTQYDNTHDTNGDIKKVNGEAVDTSNYDAAVTTATTQLNALKTAINNTDGKSDSDSKNSWIAPTVGAVVTGAAGATILTLATRDIQNANLSAEQKQIYEDWMNNVGRHLKCYIGADEAGEYGDIISVSME